MKKYVSEYSYYKYFLPTLLQQEGEEVVQIPVYMALWVGVGNAIGGPCRSPQIESAPGHLSVIFWSWLWRST